MSEMIKQRQPMGWIMLIFWWAMILFALHASTHMVGAGDTWVAMACGRHFINHGVDTVEPFSANSHKPGPTAADVKEWPQWAQSITKAVGLDTVKRWHPTGWVDQNWLTHVFFYWLTHMSPVADAETFDKPIASQHFTYDTLVYWKYALYITTIIVVYYTGRVLGVSNVISAVFACFALFVGRTFFDIRPAGFSNLLTAVLLFIFVLTVYRNYLYIWLLVPLTILWCNLHGGYIYIFIVLVPFIGLYLLTLLPKKYSLALYYSIGWLFFYALAVKFLSHETIKTGIEPNLLPDSITHDILFWFIAAFIAGNIALLFMQNVKPAVTYLYQIIVSLIVFVAVCNRFFISGIDRLGEYDNLFRAYISDGRQQLFVFFTAFAIIALLLTAFRQRLQTISVKAWWHIVAAAAVAFIAMIVFNPFHLTNITHTLEVTVSEHAKMWKTVNEWHPAFEWDNPVGDEQPFLIMYVVMWALFALWVVALLLRPKVIVKKVKAQAQAEQQPISQYEWPKIDVTLLVIAGLTIYLAIGSRRFIPMAAIAACPVLALFIDSVNKMLVSSRKFFPIYTILTIIISFTVCILVYKKLLDMSALPIIVFGKTIDLSALRLAFLIGVALAIGVYADVCMRSHTVQTPTVLQLSQREKTHLGVITLIVVICLTYSWGRYYKAVYLNPWPDSSSLSSVFMRMSASYAKPFRACQFVRDNKMKGEVYNYWTEGGFVAYGQFPDPNTGKTPLQLYMDGRAQAAYNTDAYQRWMYIMSGGDPIRDAERAGREPGPSDYKKVGQWLDQQFAKEKVWVTFMPAAQFDSVFVKGLATNSNWRPVYLDDEQEIMVDVKTEQGIALYTGLFTGATKFPDEFSRLLTTGYNMARLQDGDPNMAFDSLAKALEIKPSNTAAIELIRLTGRDEKLSIKLTELFTRYFDDYLKNKDKYKKQDGFRDRIMAVMIVGNFLSNVDAKFKQNYEQYYEDFNKELARIGETSRW